jgi:hypothetical protein
MKQQNTVNLDNFYLSNRFNLRNLRLKNQLAAAKPLAKTGQSKITNYAKRTQFSKKSNGCNIGNNNELRRKIDNGHLVKTNPNEPKQSQFKPETKPKQTQSNPNFGLFNFLVSPYNRATGLI